MNKHCLDLYLFEDKLEKAVIYAAGAQKYSEQVNNHRDENVGLTEVNKECRNWKNHREFCRHDEQKYADQLLNSSGKDKSSKAKIQKRS